MMRHLINLVERQMNEIKEIGDFNDELNASRLQNQHVENLPASKHVGDIDDLQIYAHEHYFYVVRDGELLGKATVLDFKGHHAVSHIWFDPSIRGKNYGYRFYCWLLARGYSLIADVDQTRYSKALWMRLAQNGFVHYFEDGEIGEQVRDISSNYGSDWKGHRNLIAVAE